MEHKARKRFGQNFLQDPNIIYSILGNIQVQKGDHWVEIGPGLGAITEPLLENDIDLDVIELDRNLVRYLEEKFGSNDRFTMYGADALNFDYASLVKDNQKIRIIGNLPYNISTPLLFHLLKSANCIEDMHFMLQKEVVDRICSEPGTKKYGRLTIMMQYYCESEFVFDVPPESFDPIPKVMSSIVKITPLISPPVEIESIEKLNKVVVTAFSQRRKTIRNSLRKLLDEEQIRTLNIDPTLRAESLSLAEFASLSRII